MLRLHHRSRLLTAGASAAAVLAVAAPAHAKESARAACASPIRSYKDALASQKAGHLRDAYLEFADCGRQTVCGGLAPRCRAAAEKLASQMPSVVPIVTDASGAPSLDVEVRMDGRTVATQLDFKGIPVEIGPHEFTFARGGRVIATERLVIVEGDRDRKIDVTLGAPGSSAGARPPVAPSPSKGEAVAATAAEPATDPAPSAPPRGEEPAAGSTGEARATSDRWTLPKSPWPYAAAVVGVAGVGVGALLTAWGNRDNDQAVAHCNHSCPASTADHIRTLYAVADVSFGIGLVGLGVATWMFARSRAEEAPAPRAAYVVDLQPTRSGAFASLKGTF